LNPEPPEYETGVSTTTFGEVTSNKVTSNFAGLVTSCLRPDVARGPPGVPICSKAN